MHQNTYYWLGTGVVIAALIGCMLFFFGPNRAVAPSNNATSTPSNGASSTVVDLGNGEKVTIPAGATVTETDIKIPNLAHQVSYSPNLSPEVLSVLKADIASSTAYLKTHGNDGDAWLQLAVYYKIAGDYSAAESVWIFMTQVSPKSYVAFADLGDLYQNFMVNYQKAVTYDLAAIKLNPKFVDAYINLYNIYKYHLNEPAKASAIVAQGLSVNPGDPLLASLQGQ